jgi:cation transport ATPase
MNKIRIIIAFLAFLCFSSTAHTTFAQDNSIKPKIVSSNEDNPVNVNSGFLPENVTSEKTDSKKDKDEVKVSKKFAINFIINILTMLIITLLIYYPGTRQVESLFTFFMFNVVIYMLTYVLNEIKISMGAAFGLFAVFSMLRYRTQGISMKEMTYLFIFIAIGLISAVRLDYIELSIINGIIIVFTFILGSNIFIKQESVKQINYENIELIKAENHELLMEDLKKRTGLNIHRIHIRKINFLRDTASIRVYYYEKKQTSK